MLEISFGRPLSSEMDVSLTRVLPTVFTREVSLSSYNTLFQGLFPLWRAPCRPWRDCQRTASLQAKFQWIEFSSQVKKMISVVHSILGALKYTIWLNAQAVYPLLGHMGFRVGSPGIQGLGKWTDSTLDAHFGPSMRVSWRLILGFSGSLKWHFHLSYAGPRDLALE